MVGSLPVDHFFGLIFIGTIASFFSSSFNCCLFGFPFASFRDLNLSLGGKGITGKIVDSSKLSFSLPCFGVTIFLVSWTKFSFKQIESWIFTVMFCYSRISSRYLMVRALLLACILELHFHFHARRCKIAMGS